MMDRDQVVKIMDFLNKSKLIYDKSIYKYGVYKIVLQEYYPGYTDYKLKKVFDELLNHNYINKVECHKSFKYQFNGCNLYDTKKAKNDNKKRNNVDEDNKIIVRFD